MEMDYEIERGDTSVSLTVRYERIWHSGEPGSLCIERGFEIDIWSIVDAKGNEVQVTPAEYDEILYRAIKAIQ